jgi:hypothetical protein
MHFCYNHHVILGVEIRRRGVAMYPCGFEGVHIALHIKDGNMIDQKSYTFPTIAHELGILKTWYLCYLHY